jgi:hypothetical protein
MKTYTVFIRQSDGRGTTFITSVEATNTGHASSLACAECAGCWKADLADLHVLGIAAGNVDILEWEDLDQ